jgi:hypothetical protein
MSNVMNQSAEAIVAQLRVAVPHDLRVLLIDRRLQGVVSASRHSFNASIDR